jgi:small subunit ribosomal protein S4
MVHGPKEKKERSLGEHLHTKGTRCDGPKCAVVRRPYKPGVHGQTGRRKMPSDFSRQLSEKQKFKVSYGIHERTLRRLFEIASESTDGTDRKLLELFERRLDNVLFRLRFAPSRGAARAIVVNGHILVNGRKVRSPGFQVSKGDKVTIRNESKSKGAFKELPKELEKAETPDWLSLVPSTLEGTVVGDPRIDSPFEISLLVESFSK